MTPTPLVTCVKSLFRRREEIQQIWISIWTHSMELNYRNVMSSMHAAAQLMSALHLFLSRGTLQKWSQPLTVWSNLPLLCVVDQVIFCPFVWSIHFSSGIGLPLFNISRFLKAQFQALAHAPFIETEVLFASPQCFFTAMRVYVRSARLNRFYTYVKYITYSIRKDL